MPRKPVQDKQRLMDFIKAANGSLTRQDFNASFAQIVRMVKLAISQLDARITARLATIKDGAVGPRGPQGPKGDSIQGPKGDRGDVGPTGADGDAGADADAQDVLPQIMAEIDKRIPLLGDALRAGLEQHVKETIAKQPYSMGGGAVVSIMENGVQKVQQVANMNFKGSGAPTVTIGANGITELDFPGTSGTQVYNEVVSGSSTTFTLAHTPQTGTLRLYAQGQRLLPIQDYSLSGAVITTIDTLQSGQLYADYAY